jgi:hypothetical protein
MERQQDSKRQRDRETERQRDRETKRQREKKITTLSGEAPAGPSERSQRAASAHPASAAQSSAVRPACRGEHGVYPCGIPAGSWGWNMCVAALQEPVLRSRAEGWGGGDGASEDSDVAYEAPPESPPPQTLMSGIGLVLRDGASDGRLSRGKEGRRRPACVC